MTNFEKFGKEIIVDLIKERGYGIGGFYDMVKLLKMIEGR